MTRAASAECEAEVLDLLVEWGVGADPSSAAITTTVAALREELSRGVREPAELLELVLARGAEYLGAELVQRIREALTPAVGSGPRTRGRRTRLGPLVVAAEREITERVEAARERVAERIAEWARHLSPEEADRLLPALWESERGASIEDLLDAADRIASLEAAVGELRATRVVTLRERIALAERAGRDRAVIAAAQAALDDPSPARLAGAIGSLDDVERSQDYARRLEELALTQERLAALVARLRERTGVIRSRTEATGALLAEAATRAEESLERSRAAPAPSVVTSVLRAQASWVGALEALLEIEADSEHESRRGLIAELLQDLTDLAGELQRKEASGGEPAVVAEARRLLEASAAAGPAPFCESVLSVVDRCLALREQVATRARVATTELQGAMRRVSATLDRAAQLLPTQAVVRAALDLDAAERAIEAGSPRPIEELTAGMAEVAAQLERLTHGADRERRKREEAGRELLAARAERLRAAANPRQARQLAALAAAAAKADAARLEALETRLRRLEQATRNELQLAAGRTLFLSERWLRRAKDGQRDTARHVRERGASLAEAMAGGSLAELRGASLALRSALERASFRFRPAARVVLVVALALAAGGLVATGWWWTSRPEAVRLEFNPPPTEERTVELHATEDGRAPIRETLSPGTPELDLRLPRGTWEVFVDQRYTGVRIHVPNGGPIDRVPVPPLPTAAP